MADHHAVGVFLLKPPARCDHHAAAQPGLRSGSTPSPTTGRSERPLLSRPAKYSRPITSVHAGHRQDFLAQRLGVVDQIFFRAARAVLEVAAAGDLQVAGLGMDQDLAQLGEDVMHEAAAQDQADHAGDDGQQRHAGAGFVA